MTTAAPDQPAADAPLRPSAVDPSLPKRRVEIYDTTLRDGTQGIGVSLTLVDKLNIAQRLERLGVDYIEAGFPLSNPKDVAFFEQARDHDWQHAKITAFGMTRRKGVGPEDDPGTNALVDAKTPVITVVGKTWDLHVDEVLRVSREENLAMIQDSVRFCAEAGHVEQVMYDAEHFFDGYKANPDYALETLKAAVAGGATRLVLCDTNGGSLPQWVAQATTEVKRALGLADPSTDHPAPNPSLAIHCHNDSGVATANTLAAIDAGAVQAQGTVNGIGERCGNVDLTTVIANLILKLPYDCLLPGTTGLHQLAEVSRYVHEVANLQPLDGQPYVGNGAFAHKGGMHVHAVRRVAHSYEHVDPGVVGNTRRILVSELAGVSNVAETIGKKFDIEHDKDLQRKVLNRVQDLENEGYQFEAARASFELLLRDALGQAPTFWTLDHYRCVILKQDDQPSTTEATVKLAVDGADEHRVAEGDGPVNALDGALRKALANRYPVINDVHLIDYKVRVVNPTAESAAKVRVIATFKVADDALAEKTGNTFGTIGVNENIVDASWQALTDAFRYVLSEG
ncbi:MAG: citramalate synthase [Planctomycetota bacterium]